MICGRPPTPEPDAARGEPLASESGGSAAGPAVSAAAAALPVRGAAAGRPARRLLDLGLLNFLLVLIGTSSLVAGTWNARRHSQVADLRDVRDRLERERVDLESAIAEQRLWYEGIETDPILRRELLERLLGASPAGGIPLDEWLRGTRKTPEA